MLRLSNTVLTGVAAVALLASSPAFAQLSGKLDTQEQQLAQAEKTCGPVNLAEYANLLNEAQQNRQRADKAKKKGVPVDDAQVNADLAKAMTLFARAQAAQARNCMMQAQQQAAQPPAAQPAATPQTTPGTAPGGQGAAGLNSRLDDAEKKLADDIKACRPIKADDYQPLVDEMRRNLKAGRKALEKGVPVDVDKLLSDSDRASNLIEQAKAAEAKQSNVCPPKREAQTEPPPQPPQTNQSSMNLDPWSRDVFAVHNATRNAVGSPPLQWREDLAQHAQARAEELAQAQQLIHAPREGRGTERENILQAPRGYTAAQEMGRWTREASDFVPGKFPEVSRTGNWMDVAHYTQMVSIQTTSIGCGHAMGGGFDWVVCRYDPGGNKDGKPILADANTQPQLVMREKEAALPKTDTSRVHQTPMAQPQLDQSLARMVAEDVRHPWNEQHPKQPVSQPMTPPPESILDDVATDNFIRPRLIGGDYGSDADLVGIYNVNLTGGLAHMFAELFLFTNAVNYNVALNMLSGSAYANYLSSFPSSGVHYNDLTTEYDQAIATGIPANSLLLSFGCIYDGLDNVDLGLIRTPFNLVPGLNQNGEQVGEGLQCIYPNSGLSLDIFQTPAPFTVLLLGEQPAAPVQKCPVDFGSANLSRKLAEAEADLNKKLAAGEWVDSAEYEKLAAEAEQDKNAAAEADRAAGGGIDARPFLQNSDKAQRLLKSAKAAADKQTVDTKVEAPDVGGTPALIDPNAPSPIQLKLSDCVM